MTTIWRSGQNTTNWAEHFKRISALNVDFGADINTTTQVQHILNQLGAYPPLVEDGIWGPKTQSAIELFQKNNGMTVTGVVDAALLKIMKIKVAGTPITTTSSGVSVSGIRQAVIDAFTGYSQGLEGAGTNFMYTDSKGYVTTGIGDLIDPVSSALPLPWKRNGVLVSQDDIINAWTTVKNAWPDVQSYACASLTDIRLDSEGMAALVARQIKANHEVLITEFPSYVSWPADAQMAMHSISWEWGAGFPRVWGQNGLDFKAALNSTKPDFLKAADIMTQASIHEESINPGTIKRDADNRVMFTNAAQAQTKKANYNTLFYPSTIVTAAVGLFGFFVASGIGVLSWISYGNYKKSGRFLPW
jgi:peptidoglycan hydrolase-like protein with peptidoglycan-binding domain